MNSNAEMMRKYLNLFENKKMKDDPCWKGYKMVGTKKKKGKEVPNCVPEGLDYDTLRGKGTEHWQIVFTYGAGRGGKQQAKQRMTGIPTGSSEKEVLAIFKKTHRNKHPISAKKIGIVEDAGNLSKNLSDDLKLKFNSVLRNFRNTYDAIDYLMNNLSTEDSLWVEQNISKIKKFLRKKGFDNDQTVFEKSLTKKEEKNKEKYVKGMKKDKKGFKKRYGDEAEEVMYATATKMAKESTDTILMSLEEKFSLLEKEAGMSDAERKAYNRKHGSNLKRAQPGGGKRRTSYCARSKGQMDMHNINCRKTPDKKICKARRDWNC